MKRKTVLIAMLALCLVLCSSEAVFAEACYGVCPACNGTGHCDLCDPAKNPDGLGNGLIKCEGCHSTGYVICGSQTNGDGEPIGCDGSGYDAAGGICGVCNGEGKYPCDRCRGVAGIYDKCRCVTEGHGGCLTCCGTGWLYADRGGRIGGTNSGGNVLYPKNGDTVFLGGGQRATYSEALGVNLSPVEYKEALAEAAKTDPPKKDPDPKPADDNKNENPPMDNPSDNPPKDNPSDNPPVENPDNPPDDNPNVYETKVSDSSKNTEQVKDSGTDMIYLFNEMIDGRRVSVQIIKSSLAPDEKAALERMKESDFDELKAAIAKSAKGFCRIRGDERLQLDEGAFIEHFRFGTGLKLPFKCDVLVELESESLPESLNLYCIETNTAAKLGINAIDNAGERNYLIFSTNSLGEYALCEGELRIAKSSDTGNPPDGQGSQSDTPLDNRDGDDIAKDTDGESHSGYRIGFMTYVIMIAIALAVLGILIAVNKKKIK